jgi:hypothetical protein
MNCVANIVDPLDTNNQDFISGMVDFRFDFNHGKHGIGIIEYSGKD